MTELSDTYFLANGKPYEGQVFENAKGQTFGEVMKPCPSCGGRGWRGRNPCRSCGGEKQAFDQALVFTQDQLEKRLAERAKRNRKKQDLERSRQEAIKAQCEAFIADHPKTFALAFKHRDAVKFIDDVLSQFERTGLLSESQMDNLERIVTNCEADLEQFADRKFIGAVGDCVELELTAVRCETFTYKPPNCPAAIDLNATLFMDASGNAVCTVHPEFKAEPGERLIVAGKVKAHDTSQGWPRTQVSQPERIASLEAETCPNL